MKQKNIMDTYEMEYSYEQNLAGLQIKNWHT